MVARVIRRGDSYNIRRPLYVHQFYDEDMEPFDLTSCTVRSTFKVILTTPDEDPTDEEPNAVVKSTLVVNGAGTATTEDGLYMIGLASEGKVEQRVTAVETATYPVDVELTGDVEITDANGDKTTFDFSTKLKVRETVTNRTVG